MFRHGGGGGGGTLAPKFHHYDKFNLKIQDLNVGVP